MPMSDVERGFDEIGERLEQRHRKRQEVQDAVEQIPALEYQAQSADGVFAVQVNGEGLLTALQVGPGVAGYTPDQVAETILAAYNSAQRYAAGQAAELVASVAGDEGHLQERLRARQEFTATTGGEQPPSSPPPPSGDDGDYSPTREMRA